MPKLEEVFTLSGIPRFTFVTPMRYGAIKVAIRTFGRCVVIEGPSGIGKTTVVTKIIEDIGQEDNILNLSARKENDIPYIENLPEMGAIGTVIVDDFHRLDDTVKEKLSNFMKVLADTGDPNSKLILIGINKAGDQLINYAHDLGMRIDIFKMEANPSEKILELIEKGQEQLNIDIRDRKAIAEKSQGSFHIAQALCHNLCVEADITESQKSLTKIGMSADVVVERTMANLELQFMEAAVAFARGSKIRREGRAPYLHILKWLSETNEWSLDLGEAVRANPEHEASVNQVIKNGHLSSLLSEKAEVLSQHFHYQPQTKVLSVEDPKFIFFLKNLVWRNFTKKVGYTAEYFRGKYDIALSFSGEDREVAAQLFKRLTDREVAVFYDENEQHRIIAKDVEDYLAPIYRSEANYVVPLLSQSYPNRIWTKFESENFRHRFGDNCIIPIRYRTTSPGFFSEEQKYGSLSFDPSDNIDSQIEKICDIICERLKEDREKTGIS